MATDHLGRAEDRYVSIKSIKSKFSVFQKKQEPPGPCFMIGITNKSYETSTKIAIGITLRWAMPKAANNVLGTENRLEGVILWC